MAMRRWPQRSGMRPVRGCSACGCQAPWPPGLDLAPRPDHDHGEGREADFDAWLVGVLGDAGDFIGYQGYVEIPPGKDPLERHIAFRFDRVAQLNDFWCSETYAGWKERLAELISAPSNYRQEFGIEHWFLEPNCIVAPSRH